MACVHPLTAWRRRGSRDKPSFVKPVGIESYLYEELQIPCGQCIGCRLDYSRQWATRMMLEAKSWEQNWFVTLTYNPESEPFLLHQTVCIETGEIFEGLSLQPHHMTKFMKDFREWFRRVRGHVGIRFYLCGEYGELYGRPHYHLALFNVPFQSEDLIFYKYNELGDPLYKCPILDELWGYRDKDDKFHNFGFSTVGELTWQSAAYIARYMLKKQKGKDASWYYASQGILPEFTRMSRRPGIGKEYFEEHFQEIYKNDEIVVSHRSGPMLVKPPRYYDKLYDTFDSETMTAIKERRRNFALEQKKVMEKNSNLSFEEINQAKERRLQNSSRALIRSVEKGKV